MLFFLSHRPLTKHLIFDFTMFVLAEFPLYYLHSILDTVASFADILTDDSFWTLFLGERGLTLIKRYIANDAIFVGLFLSLGRKYILIIYSIE